MKITKRQLREMIKEEKIRLLKEEESTPVALTDLVSLVFDDAGQDPTDFGPETTQEDLDNLNGRTITWISGPDERGLFNVKLDDSIEIDGLDGRHLKPKV